MRKHLLGLTLIAGLAGCTSEFDSDRTEASSPVAKAEASAAADLTPESLATLRGSSTSFASLPDRGELLSYGGGRKARQSGAYSYHPVAISEAHALNAIGKGEMVVTMPDGKPLRLAYQRHEEQPDGNWTWIGGDADGSNNAVLTFGDKAVFGMISVGDDYYRVRTDATGAWVVATDRSRVASGGGQRASGPDFLAPPEGGGVLAASATSRLAKSGAAAAAVNEKATAVVDVVIGYSSSIATRQGSQAAAVTLVANLVALSNAAYASSGVNMRLRLVHAMSVTYADTSDNQDALQKLTGYDATTQQPITVDSAFTALRSARNEYGADVVAFVRGYREPEQDGCGIAWLLGMNQSGITVAGDAEFAYAVVSDGEDRDEGDGNTYFCSDYSLAHELGHVMGQAHNTQDAQGRAGAHTYSYGYRESSATGFFTIMAYPSGDNQIEAPYFANPAVNYLNRPTGTATADNVRSMNQTMPIIAQFRATVVPLGNVRSDFDGDGKSDVIFRNSSTGQNAIWKSVNIATQQQMATVASQAWIIAGTGDFNGDGKVDVLWRNTSTGNNVIWRSGLHSQQQTVATVANQNWKVAGVGDFNGDGVADILWRRADTGQNVIWLSGHHATQLTVATVVGGGWTVAGVGDFNGDGRSDILWRSTTTGNNTIWRSASSASQQAVTSVPSQAWRVAGVADFNGDGLDDVLWSNASTGANSIWRGGSSGSQQAVVSTGTAWAVAAVGDYDGDGRADILWRNSANGNNVYWKSGNHATQQPVAAVPNQAWKVFY
ncbi:FG-GAP-like repeat-containing protein [Luteimonas marina]|nr:FG-GAP-like repeat-containing protein [Luteimonas marina]